MQKLMDLEKNVKNFIAKEVQPLNLKDLRKIRFFFEKRNKIVVLGIINIGVNIALRYSDLVSLKFENINLDNTIVLREKKTLKKKYIKLNKVCIEEIRKLKIFYFSLGLENYNKGYIFKSLNRFNIKYDIDSALTIQSFNRYLKFATKELNIKYNVGSHSLRKTWGKLYYEKYNDIVTIMEILNHTSISSTLRYIGINQEKIIKIYDNFLI